MFTRVSDPPRNLRPKFMWKIIPYIHRATVDVGVLNMLNSTGAQDKFMWDEYGDTFIFLYPHGMFF